MEGNLHVKIDWASLIVGGKFFIWGIFPSPPGGLYLEGRFNRGVFALQVWGAYSWRGYTWRGLFSEFYGMFCTADLIFQWGPINLGVNKTLLSSSLRSMAVLSSRAHERRSREIRARERAAKPREKEQLLPPQSPRGFSALACLYYLATKTAMLRRLTQLRPAVAHSEWQYVGIWNMVMGADIIQDALKSLIYLN